jgi:hypothetical protein
MKRGYLFTALLFAVFMFPFFGSISNADALGNYGCYEKSRWKHALCLRGKLDTTPYGLTVPQGKKGGQYGCHDRDRETHINCLKGLLDQHGPHMQVNNSGGGDSGMNPPGGEHHDPNMPPPGGDDHSGDTHGEPDIDRCATMHPGGPSRHVDPPEALIERITREYEGRLRQAPGGILHPGQLLSGGTYSLLRHPQNGGHIPPEVDCYLREGRDNHPPAGNP